MKQGIIGWATGMVLVASCGMAQAQWLWVNDKGVKQFSDQPPPASVPPSRILKAPKGQMPEPAKTDEAAGEAAPEPKATPRPTLAERNADFNKRRAAAAEQAQKAETDARAKASNEANCENIRNNQRALEAGMRISSFDRNGERVILDDAQRAEQSKRNTAMLAANCK
ncbi:DUF4124 domain-containing protein [Massilia endophytica]|uniref:DUF4124 domain-containing protein n=1 Tax=Massilia endophytica TaxID=2899220 RepID=UPI001E5182AD|nr:DUF4124 domain-containing protein [Massilia endophytica]UGQ48828.1 DUF4124 domain-containing protein [Massilia endophytica]